MRTGQLWMAVAAGCLIVAGGCGVPPRDAAPGITPAASAAVGVLGHGPDLYVGTPAEHFAVGEAALVLPSNPVVAGATPRQVADALATVRQELVAAFLSDQLLVHHDPSAVLAPFAPAVREDVRADIAAGTEGTTFVQFVDGAHLASPPRLDGSITVSMSTSGGVRSVDVISNYVVAYAFTGATALVLVRSQTHWLFPFARDVVPTSVGMFLGDRQGFWQGMDCAASAHGRTGPQHFVDPQAKPFAVDTRSPDSYYDPQSPPTVSDSCFSTGTATTSQR